MKHHELNNLVENLVRDVNHFRGKRSDEESLRSLLRRNLIHLCPEAEEEARAAMAWDASQDSKSRDEIASLTGAQMDAYAAGRVSFMKGYVTGYHDGGKDE